MFYLKKYFSYCNLCFYLLPPGYSKFKCMPLYLFLTHDILTNKRWNKLITIFDFEIFMIFKNVLILIKSHKVFKNLTCYKYNLLNFPQSSPLCLQKVKVILCISQCYVVWICASLAIDTVEWNSNTVVPLVISYNILVNIYALIKI